MLKIIKLSYDHEKIEEIFKNLRFHLQVLCLIYFIGILFLILN